MMERAFITGRKTQATWLAMVARVSTLQTFSHPLVPVVSQPALAQDLLMSTNLVKRVSFPQAHSTTKSPVHAMISSLGDGLQMASAVSTNIRRAL